MRFRIEHSEFEFVLSADIVKMGGC